VSGAPARLVTFDGDDTLWELAPVIERALDSSCVLLGRHFPEIAVTPADLNDDRLAVQGELPADSPMRDYRRAAYRRRVDLLGGGSEQLVDELTEHFQLQRSALIEPYPDALAALDRLAPHAQLGLISNGNADVELTQFAGRFALRLHAHVDGPLKPDPALFALALERTGVAAPAAVHVGDSLLQDVVGAQAAGWRAIWLNRDRSPNETGIEPDAEVATLDELDGVLERLIPQE
jgi:putative hydrolase of the HAD superfamily